MDWVDAEEKLHRFFEKSARSFTNCRQKSLLLEGISGYVRINVIHSIDIATPARVPSKRGQSQIISSSKEGFWEEDEQGLTN